MRQVRPQVRGVDDDFIVLRGRLHLQTLLQLLRWE